MEANMLMAQEEGKATSTAITGLQSIETLKASRLETGWFGQWSRYDAKACNARQRLEASSGNSEHFDTRPMMPKHNRRFGIGGSICRLDSFGNSPPATSSTAP